ncbi:Uncharacterised protein [Serratia quinivorans]|nr:Uncharacterised protein [Serratia quinivorans]
MLKKNHSRLNTITLGLILSGLLASSMMRHSVPK